MRATVCGPDPQITITLGPLGPVALVYVVAFYGTGRFFAALGLWLIFRFGIVRRLGIAMSEREMRDELEHRLGLFSGAVYLVFWIITFLGVGPIH